MKWLYRGAVMLLVAGLTAAAAQPRVPSSDLPGRERYRFTPSPEFMQPQPLPEPLIRPECDRDRAKPRLRKSRNC